MALIACKLQKFSALEHLLKLKSMLNVFSNKIWKQILQQTNDIENPSLPIGKHRSWSMILPHIKNNGSLSHRRTNTNIMQWCCCTQKATRVSISWWKSSNFNKWCCCTQKATRVSLSWWQSSNFNEWCCCTQKATRVSLSWWQSSNEWCCCTQKATRVSISWWQSSNFNEWWCCTQKATRVSLSWWQKFEF